MPDDRLFVPYGTLEDLVAMTLVLPGPAYLLFALGFREICMVTPADGHMCRVDVRGAGTAVRRRDEKIYIEAKGSE